jgi:hypothetical protein
MKFSKEEKRMWLEDWRGSGKSAWSYAKANGLCPQTFVKWTKTGAESNTSFVEVSVPNVKTSDEKLQEILIEKGDVKIHIPLEPCLNELRAAFKRLGGI